MILADYPTTTIVKCPHCNFVNKVRIDYSDRDFRPQIVICDSEEGGCDEEFAVLVAMVPHVQVYKLIRVDVTP